MEEFRIRRAHDVPRTAASSVPPAFDNVQKSTKNIYQDAKKAKEEQIVIYTVFVIIVCI